MITIFTPTYNRAYSLPRLYESLKKQTYNNFEWILVNDGSTDNTDEVVKPWLNDNVITINYIKQKNGGKHRAINKGIEVAKGDYFFIVDSDDFLPEDSLELVQQHIEEIKNDTTFAGVCGTKCYPNNQRVGGSFPYEILDTDSVSFRIVHKIKGDMAEVWKTSVLKEFPFPEFEGEKFVTEAIVWNKIAKKYKLRYFNKNIYICEYLDDGLTKNIRRHHRNSPKASQLFYSEIIKDNRFDKITRIKSAINFWRYSINTIGKNLIPLWVFLFYPIGLLFYLKDISIEK